MLKLLFFCLALKQKEVEQIWLCQEKIKFSGEIEAGSDEINLKIEKGLEIPGYGSVLLPEISSISVDLITKTFWNELRATTNEKSYYSEPKAHKQLKP